MCSINIHAVLRYIYLVINLTVYIYHNCVKDLCHLLCVFRNSESITIISPSNLVIRNDFIVVLEICNIENGILLTWKLLRAILGPNIWGLPLNKSLRKSLNLTDCSRNFKLIPLKVSFSPSILHFAWLYNVQKAETKTLLLPVSNGGPVTSLPPGGVLSCGGCCTPNAPVVRAGLAKGGLSSQLGENCQPGVTLGGIRGIRQQHQRRSQGQSWAVCLESGWKQG